MAAVSIVAKYAGECVAECGDPIQPGDLIVDLCGHQYAHERCAATAPDEEPGKRTKFRGTTLEDMGF